MNFLETLQLSLQNFISVTLIDILDIFIVAVIIYYVLKLIRETSSARILRGVLVVLLMVQAADILGFNMLSYLFQTIVTWGIIVLIILFQPELRRVLERIGKTSFAKIMVRSDEQPIEEAAISQIVAACKDMSWTRTGALIIFERAEKLDHIARTGTIVDATVSDELVRNVFYPKSPLHDGAMIVRDSRIYAAGCVLPLSANQHLPKELGTRHRAAVGMSEASDCVSLIVSEETGAITVVMDGVLQRNLVPEQLYELLCKQLMQPTEEETEKKSVWKNLFKIGEQGRRKK